MTLLELLVQELPKIGGWPKNANKLKFSAMKRIVDDVGNEHFHLPALDRLVLSERVKFVTRKQYDEALAATKEQKMKYEYLKGSENDFEGAPEWCTHVSKSHSNGGWIAWEQAGESKKGNMYQWNDGESPVNTYEHEGVVLNIIAERRPITEPEWDGVGLPPVGCECEAMISNPTAVGRAWRKVKVVHVGTPGLKSEALVFDVETARPSWADEFRPIRTDADKKRDSSTSALSNYLDDIDDTDSPMGIADAIYDAIASGKIPGVKLED